MPSRIKNKSPAFKATTLAQHIALQRHALFMSLIKISFTVLLAVIVFSVCVALWMTFSRPDAPGDTELMPLLNTFVEVFKIAVSLR